MSQRIFDLDNVNVFRANYGGCDLQDLLWTACYYNSLNIVKYIVNSSKLNRSAIINNHIYVFLSKLPIVQWIVIYFKITYRHYAPILSYVAMYGKYYAVIEYLLLYFNLPFEIVHIYICSVNRPQLLELYVRRNQHNLENIYAMFSYCCKYGYLDNVKTLHRYYKFDKQEKYCVGILQTTNISVIEYLLSS